jgi:pantoate--beta-alanine ligase
VTACTADDRPALFDNPTDMRRWSDRQRAAGSTVAMVPTMGALHAGHLALIATARRNADVVVVSIFVNPLQFGLASDFDAYPRPLDDDLRSCASAGVDAVYAPTAATMYPPGFQTHVEPGPLADRLEGEHRPGHFRGVTTVVTKLFGAVRPDVAIFGQKDAQQLAIVRQMSSDLDLGVRIIAMPTVRESDGLAMSSRNRRLNPQQRRAAVCIARGLRAAETMIANGERYSATVAATIAGTIEAEPLARLEHVEVVDARTLEAIDRIGDHTLIVVAVWFGEVRLIDNLLIESFNRDPNR